MAASQSTCASGFRSVFNIFMTEVNFGQVEVVSLQSTSFLDLQITLSQIQSRQKATRKTMYLRRLSPFLEALQQFETVTNLFLNPAEYIACIWGSMKHLLNTASGSDEALNALLEAYGRIGESMPRLLEHQALLESNRYMQTVLTSVFEDISVFHSGASKCFKHQTWETLFRPSWQAFIRQIEYLSKDLSSYRNLLEERETVVTFKDFESLRLVNWVQFNNVREAELERRRLSVQQWLSFADPETRHEDAARHEGTGKWLLQHDLFEKWLSLHYCMEPLLWLSGIPGSGKTILASVVIEETRQLSKARTVFFYCKDSDGQRNGFVTVAKAMLAQLVPSEENLLRYLYSKSSGTGQAILSSIPLAKALLETALRTCVKGQMTYVVIDGLDEYSRDDRKEITGWFRSIIESLPINDFGMIRCLFISQDDGPARKDFSQISQIKISPTDNKKDIEIYCKSWYEKIEAKFGPLDDRNGRVSKMVTSRAQDIFLLAKLTMSNLYDQMNRRDLMEELNPDKLPTGLDQVYAKVIERILGSTTRSTRRRDNARKLLGWLACARRPLKWYEVQGAVSIDLEGGNVSPDLEFKEDCKDLCGSLVENTSDGIVTLVHSTAKQYLVEQDHIQLKDVESELAILCLGYLSFDCFALDCPVDKLQHFLTQGYYAFSGYAVCFWPLHLEASISSLREENRELFDEMTQGLDNVLNFHWACSGKVLTISKTQAEILIPITQLPCYERASQAIAATKNQLHSRGKGPSEDEILWLPKVVSRIRDNMEEMATSENATEEMISLMTRFHGSNWFKCRRLNCQFFHQGLATQSQREYHTSKHERAFTCTEEGCPQAVIGCITEKDLQKHTAENHGVESEDGSDFPPTTDDSGTVSRTPRPKAKFRCQLCPKVFTRLYTLRSHLRIHKGERPFVCTFCGRAFARRSDCRRHERLHSNEESSSAKT